MKVILDNNECVIIGHPHLLPIKVIKEKVRYFAALMNEPEICIMIEVEAKSHITILDRVFGLNKLI